MCESPHLRAANLKRSVIYLIAEGKNLLSIVEVEFTVNSPFGDTSKTIVFDVKTLVALVLLNV